MSHTSKTSLPSCHAFYTRFFHLSTPRTKKFFALVNIDKRWRIGYNGPSGQRRSWISGNPGEDAFAFLRFLGIDPAKRAV